MIDVAVFFGVMISCVSKEPSYGHIIISSFVGSNN